MGKVQRENLFHLETKEANIEEGYSAACDKAKAEYISAVSRELARVAGISRITNVERSRIADLERYQALNLERSKVVVIWGVLTHPPQIIQKIMLKK
eukprot:SAG11_NODE_401_length_9759_cov_119.937992_3_plen_97_part_00